MKKTIPLLLVLITILLISAGCGGPSASDDSLDDPAVGNDTPIEEEADSCALLCDIGQESYAIIIPCESGSMSTQSMGETRETTYDADGLTAIKLNLNQVRTYELTGNSYEIVGFIEVSDGNPPLYEITVTGGVYGEVPQTCQP